jgi:hypothetical protein
MVIVLRSSVEPDRVSECKVGVGTPVAATYTKMQDNRNKKHGDLSLEEPLCAVFNNSGGEDLISGASVPEPVTGWMKFVGNGEKEELAPETA